MSILPEYITSIRFQIERDQVPDKGELLMVKEILPGIYRLKVPLPRNPLGVLNSYLIKDGSRGLLVDTGFNWPECRSALLAGIDRLGLSPSDLDYFITHVHADHSGLVYQLAQPGSRVYLSELDARVLKSSFDRDFWQEVEENFRSHGFPGSGLARQAGKMESFISGHDLSFTYIYDGFAISAGPYNFTCLLTPGHSPGHACLYDKNKKLLICGDHILPDISPNITAWLEMEDSLGEYLASLERVAGLDIDMALPGHRGLITDCRGRIEELKRHHQLRLQEIVEIISREGHLNAYQIAGLMTWDMTYDSWEDLPVYQRWFATGEAIAHLEHLVKIGQIQCSSASQGLVYELVADG